MFIVSLQPISARSIIACPTKHKENDSNYAGIEYRHNEQSAGQSIADIKNL